MRALRESHSEIGSVHTMVWSMLTRRDDIYGVCRGHTHTHTHQHEEDNICWQTLIKHSMGHQTRRERE